MKMDLDIESDTLGQACHSLPTARNSTPYDQGRCWTNHSSGNFRVSYSNGHENVLEPNTVTISEPLPHDATDAMMFAVIQ